MNKITLTLLLGLLAACTHITPNYDKKFGDAVRAARQAQTLNASAPADADPVMGLDAQAGVKAQERYQESFKTPPKSFDVINIGAGVSGQ